MNHPIAASRIPTTAGIALPGRRLAHKIRFVAGVVISSKEALVWQAPIPAVDHKLIDAHDIAALKDKMLASGLSISQLVTTAWASAATFRGSDKRGGANGARIRLAPQKNWEVNQPAELEKVLPKLEAIRKDFNSAQSGGKKVSLADLIVPGGCAAVEAAAKKAGQDVKIPFSLRRLDASQEQTDVGAFALLEPAAGGFRNYARKGLEGAAAELLVDKAQLLTLTAPEMAVLIGGLRAQEATARTARRLFPVVEKAKDQPTSDLLTQRLEVHEKRRGCCAACPRIEQAPA